MVEKLRMLNASEFEGDPVDRAVHFVHDVFHRPIHSLIGTSFTAFVAAAFMAIIVADAQFTNAYIGFFQ